MPESFVAAAEALEDALCDLEPRLYSGEDAARGVEVLARAEKVCAAAKVRLAARAAECGAHKKHGYRDASDWLSRQTGTSAGEAKAQIETAKAVEDLPETRQALVNGELSLAQAGEIVKTEAECPGAEAELLKTARTEALPRLRDKARRMRRRATDEAELQRKRVEAQGFRSWTDELGMACGSFRMLPEVGMPFLAKVDAETDRIWREAGEEKRAWPRERLAAEAFAKVVSGRGKGHATRADLVLVCDLGALRRGHAEAGEVCHVVGGPEVPVSAARGLVQDAFLKAVLHDGKQIHTVAHFGRHVPAELRTALELGSPPEFEGPRCADCGRRYHLQDDHVDPRANGGPTSLENIENRCPPCHAEKTERDRKAGLLGNGANGSRHRGKQQRGTRQRAGAGAGAGAGRRAPP